MLKKLLVILIIVVVAIAAIVGKKAWQKRVLPPYKIKPAITAKLERPLPHHYCLTVCHNGGVVLYDDTVVDTSYDFSVWLDENRQWHGIVVCVQACNEYNDCVPEDNDNCSDVRYVFLKKLTNEFTGQGDYPPNPEDSLVVDSESELPTQMIPHYMRLRWTKVDKDTTAREVTTCASSNVWWVD